MLSHTIERNASKSDDGAAAGVSDSSSAPASESSFGEAQSVQLARGVPRLLLTVATNLLVLVEVFIAMYFAAKTPEEITPVFFKFFFSMLLPTLALAFILKRLIARKG
jgi:hypothetical protein